MSTETSHFQALKWLAFLLITIFGCWENLHGISRENVGKEWSFSHKNSPALKHTRYSITVPDVFPFLQYWQTDGAFLLCVFVRPLIFFLLTMQLSLLMETLENTIIDTQHHSFHKDNFYSHYKDVLQTGKAETILWGLPSNTINVFRVHRL